jgi:predicted DNA-binding transcriptional regulator YafY
MSKSIEQQQRRIEMVGLVAMHQNHYSIGDFANLFNIDEEMVKKDLNALRSEGIAIHQLRKQGISITNDVNPELLEMYLIHYMLASKTNTKKDRLLSQLVKRNGLFSIGLIVSLQRAIRERFKIQFEYMPNKGSEVHLYEVEPLLLFQREGLWRLLARSKENIIQFHIAKIVSVNATFKKFTPPPEEFIEDQFRYSWNTWISEDKIPVTMQLTDFWADRLSSRPAVDDQKITKKGKDNNLFEGTVNSIEELARWIAGRSGEVIALSPDSLRKKVMKYASQCMKVHKD